MAAKFSARSALLARLRRHEARIAKANREGLRRMFGADPVLVDVQPAGSVMPGLGERVVLHAGPPIEWKRMCGPMRGAVAGAIVFEGWAPDLKTAARLAARVAARVTAKLTAGSPRHLGFGRDRTCPCAARYSPQAQANFRRIEQADPTVEGRRPDHLYPT